MGQSLEDRKRGFNKQTSNGESSRRLETACPGPHLCMYCTQFFSEGWLTDTTNRSTAQGIFPYTEHDTTPYFSLSPPEKPSAVLASTVAIVCGDDHPTLILPSGPHCHSLFGFQNHFPVTQLTLPCLTS